MEALREGQAEEIVQTAVARAKAGDGPMLRCLVARLFPVPRHPGVELDVPEGREHDPRAVVESALRGLVRGEITPEEAFLIARTLEKAAAMMQAASRPARRAAGRTGSSKPATPAVRPEQARPENRLYPGEPAPAAAGAAPSPSPASLLPPASVGTPPAGPRREHRLPPSAGGLPPSPAATGAAPENRLYPSPDSAARRAA
jgi:hypothetical protein